ncbi:M15 family metallopeptidase [Aquibacillus salsiterrae]|uniref:M15 family metallopeptidase n=1 Tax=Aquibacillus salsiterrae TaxID=2950439 RepID=A0A9X3WES9_9BACI|nr:M15 family metallopeptidase [Aquibacillus salsiterrae]MDC3417126.1 M15 family metallopeptidase [Aquibacillus salsiterrae]
MKPNPILILAFFSIVLLLLFLINKEQPLNKDVQPPTELHPTVKRYRDILITQADSIGINIVITDGLRSYAEQDAIYARGRTKPGNIVTNAQAGESYHNYGLAIDFALRVGDDVIWDITYDGNQNGKSDWMEVVALAKKLGFSWGGDWQGAPDYPHLQMEFGLSIWELRRGKQPNVDKYGDPL